MVESLNPNYNQSDVFNYLCKVQSSFSLIFSVKLLRIWWGWGK